MPAKGTASNPERTHALDMTYKDVRRVLEGQLVRLRGAVRDAVIKGDYTTRHYCNIQIKLVKESLSAINYAATYVDEMKGLNNEEAN